jgi:hypothetical protein
LGAPPEGVVAFDALNLSGENNIHITVEGRSEKFCCYLNVIFFVHSDYMEGAERSTSAKPLRKPDK